MLNRAFPAFLIVTATLAVACTTAGGRSGSAIRTGPQSGSVIVVGGGAMGPEIITRFIELAGGPDAPIVIIPTAQGAPSYTQMSGGSQQFRDLGAKDVVVMHTADKAIANSDAFVARIKRARGVWFPGGRHFRLVDSYAGTKSEAAFHDALARGGVVGGSSAGASILASYLIRGAPSNDNFIMSHPDYLKGFGFLKNIAIDQHVVARGRLPDLSDSVTSKRRELLGISEDEGTAWVIRGDTGEIIGRSKAFVYNGRDANDDGRPFLTLWPGDRYDLGARRVISRAIAGTRLTHAFVDSLFRDVGTAPATILVAQNGKVLVNKSWNVSPQELYQPTTTLPAFALGDISEELLHSIGRPFANENTTEAQQARQGAGRVGMAHTRYDTTAKAIVSSVDNLYRWERVLSARDDADARDIVAVYGTADGKRNAFVRDLSAGIAVIILTESDAFDARRVASAIVERLR
jgi:cyanophycinase